jgi:hypothetical protein
MNSGAIILFLILVAIPLLFGAFVEKIFWRTQLFAKFHSRAAAIDSERVLLSPIPNDGFSVKELREKNYIGDKISVTHHLARAIEDFLQGIKDGLWYTFAGVLIVVIWAVGTAADPNLDVLGLLRKLAGDLLKFYGLPLGEFAALILNIQAYQLLKKQVKYYTHVLD